MNKLNITAIAAAITLVFSAGAMAQTMSKDHIKSGKDGIAAEYKSAKAACGSLSGNSSNPNARSFQMNRLLSWLIVLGLAVGISACDKKEGVPLPKTGAGEVKQQAKEAVGAVGNAAKKEKDEFVAAVENDMQEIKA